MVVASIPASDIEIGGEGGRAALDRIENTFGRMEAIWKPVGTLEGFEIVRRRLFSPIKDEEARDGVCREFAHLYEENSSDFPPQSQESSYLERMRSAYPIHPELFDRLYDEWSTLEKFQRTRGVLRLMAAVIYELWMKEDKSYLIMPGSIPLDAPRVRNELLRYLPDGWNAVMEKDVDGERAQTRSIDAENTRFSQCAAARKIARTIFLGSAPHVRQQAVRGIEDVRILLGVVQPNESVALYNDATGRLVDRLTYLYNGNRRYWYDTQPNLRRTMEERAVKLDRDEVHGEIMRRLKQIRERGDFKSVHVGPFSSDVPNEKEVRLVILQPTQGHSPGRQEGEAQKAALEILDKRGNSPRTYRNMLLFVAPDSEQSIALEQETRRNLAWKSIVDDGDTLNLDAHQRKEAKSGVEKSDTLVDMRINDTYCWLLASYQEVKQTGEGTWEVEPMIWEITRITGSQENPVSKAAKKVKSDQRVITRWSPALLRMELDRWLWKDEPHVSLKRVWECLATYLYLSRLRDKDVLIDAIREGIATKDFFAYAHSVAPEGKYTTLHCKELFASIFLDEQSVLVRPEVALKQIEEERVKDLVTQEVSLQKEHLVPGGGQRVEPSREDDEPVLPPVPPVKKTTRFFGTVEVGALRLTKEAGDVAKEVLQHFNGIVGAQVEVSIDIRARVSEGVPEHVVRAVTENCRTLKFESYGFEEE